MDDARAIALSILSVYILRYIVAIALNVTVIRYRVNESNPEMANRLSTYMMRAMPVRRAMRGNLLTLLALAGGLIVWSFAAPAHAGVIDWNFDIVLDNTDAVTGTFVTQDTPAGGPYLITSIQDGELNSSIPITLLAPNGVFNDNLLYTSGEPFDSTGLGFQTTPDGVMWSIWFDSGVDSLVWCNNSATGVSYGCNSAAGDPIGYVSFSSVQPTPLPAALSLFTGGLGVIGLLARRKKRKTVLAAV